jgi:dTDP-4-dehydrorhamnose 3,5-epimerase
VIFRELDLPGAYTIDVEPHEDERGFFARVWCERELAEQGLDAHVSQASVAFNPRAGTLRGMHWQVAPHEETKIVRCVSGAIYDAIVDLRPASATHGRWLGVELTATSRRMVYVPCGFAHGYQTLEPDTEVLYLMSTPQAPEAARGFRYDDPAVGIVWPEAGERTISSRDLGWPPLPSK